MTKNRACYRFNRVEIPHPSPGTVPSLPNFTSKRNSSHGYRKANRSQPTQCPKILRTPHRRRQTSLLPKLLQARHLHV
jgi:hypothetical protein